MGGHAGGEQRTGAMNAFAGDPQPVEIHHRGIWYSGELLGWRHEGEGQVVARVRCVVDGLRHSTWKDLAELRLPDPRRPPRAEPFPALAGSDGTDVPEDDATRPHVLLASMRKRAAKPNHAVTPPRADRPAPVPAARPAQREASPVGSRWDRPLPERRRPRSPERESVELSAH